MHNSISTCNECNILVSYFTCTAISMFGQAHFKCSIVVCGDRLLYWTAQL